jgi:hypothetical protein
MSKIKLDIGKGKGKGKEMMVKWELKISVKPEETKVQIL